MKKALITGINGFVGPYLKKELLAHGYEVFGLSKEAGSTSSNMYFGDIADEEFVSSAIKDSMPDEIYHLAGFSSVKQSFEQPELTMNINVGGTENLLRAISKHCQKTKFLMVSSAEVYGKPARIPIPENEDLKVTSPYSLSRIKQEQLVLKYPDLHIVISRSFSHTGPGQSEVFVLSDFAKQIAEIQEGLRNPVIYTGDLSIARDFSDVRDTVNAYYLLLQKAKSGEAYNMGSGKGYVLSDLLEKMIKKSGRNIITERDPNKIRPIDIPELVADISKLRASTGWAPVYSIDRTMDDLLDYWRSKVKIS